MSQQPVEDEGVHAAGVLPEALEFGLQHGFEFGQRVEHPVAKAVLDLIPESLDRVELGAVGGQRDTRTWSGRPGSPSRRWKPAPSWMSTGSAAGSPRLIGR